MCSAALGTRVRSRGTSIALPVEYSRCTRSMSSSVIGMVRRFSTSDSRSSRAMAEKIQKEGSANSRRNENAARPLAKALADTRARALWKSGYRRLLPAVDRLRVRARDDVVHFLVAPGRHVQHQQHLALVDVLLEGLEARAGHLQPDHARDPGPEDGADDRGDQHGDQLERHAAGREVDDQRADHDAQHAAHDEAGESAVDGVGLLKVGSLVQLTQV